jgi:AbiJ N-terminal domain 4
VADEDLKRRQQLTFAQAEGAAPLPAQLKLKELSKELRALLWNVVHDQIRAASRHHDYVGYVIEEPWAGVLRGAHVYHHRMVDEFTAELGHHLEELKRLFEKGDYVAVLDWVQWVIRYGRPYRFALQINDALERGRAAYRVVDDTILPIGSEAEQATLESAFADVAATEFRGAREHLRNVRRQILRPANTPIASGKASTRWSPSFLCWNRAAILRRLWRSSKLLSGFTVR